MILSRADLPKEASRCFS